MTDQVARGNVGAPAYYDPEAKVIVYRPSAFGFADHVLAAARKGDHPNEAPRFVRRGMEEGQAAEDAILEMAKVELRTMGYEGFETAPFYTQAEGIVTYVGDDLPVLVRGEFDMAAAGVSNEPFKEGHSFFAIVDAKFLAQSMRDELAQKGALWQKYVLQLNSYRYYAKRSALRKASLYLAVGHKRRLDGGEVVCDRVELVGVPRIPQAEIVAKVRRIEKMVAGGQIEREEPCKGWCPYPQYHIKEEWQWLDDEKLDELVTEWDRLYGLRDQADARRKELDEEIRQRLKQLGVEGSKLIAGRGVKFEVVRKVGQKRPDVKAMRADGVYDKYAVQGKDSEYVQRARKQG